MWGVMVNPGLLELLREHIGQTLTPELAQDIALLSLPRPTPIDLAQFAVHEYDGLTFAPERMADIVEEMRPLHAEHWLETEKYRHGFELDFDYEEACYAESMGRYLLITARDQSGRLVGNCGCRLFNSTHTKTRVAREDTFFLIPEARRGRRAVELFRYAERCLLALGAQEVRVTVKLGNGVAKLWERLGYVRAAIELVRIFKEHTYVR